MTAILLMLVLTIITVFADALLKKASHAASSFLQPSFFVGVIIYIVTAFFWVQIYRTMKFSHAAIVYSVMLITITVMVGIFFFHEKLSVIEYVGLILGLLSVLLLSRFA
jgi:multidrug transporter EmrE-like cation transporter